MIKKKMNKQRMIQKYKRNIVLLACFLLLEATLFDGCGKIYEINEPHNPSVDAQESEEKAPEEKLTEEPDGSREKVTERMTGDKDDDIIRQSVGLSEETIPGLLAKQEDKLKALDAAIMQIEKSYGKGAIMKLGDHGKNMNIETTPTGSISLDIALGVGGIPKGRVIEIYGPESSGKTTVTLHMVAEIQKRGGIAGFVDAEHALDPTYAKKIGVDIDNLYISQPDNGEQALEITETLVRSGAVDIVIVDSVAALVPKSEIDGEMGDSHVGLQARLMSQALRKLTGVISKSNCSVVFINQLREKVGVMFGNPETTTGGRALKYYSSVRLDVRRIETLKANGEMIGNRTRVKVVKNKIAPPFKEAEFDIMFGEGISVVGDILDLAANIDVVNKSGAWYAYKGEKIGQGRENAKNYLKENPAVCEEIEQQVRKHYGLETDGEQVAAATEQEQGTAGAGKTAKKE